MIVIVFVACGISTGVNNLKFPGIRHWYIVDGLAHYIDFGIALCGSFCVYVPSWKLNIGELRRLNRCRMMLDLDAYELCQECLLALRRGD